MRQLVAFFTHAMTEFIERAKAQGVTMVKVPGFEAAWDLRTMPSSPPPAPVGYLSQDHKLRHLGDYVMPMFEEWRGRRLSEIPKKNLERLLEWLEKDGPDVLNDRAHEVLEKGWAYLRALEDRR